MKLKIISPAKSSIIEVVWIEINTPTGNFILQNNYTPTTFILSENKQFLYCFKTGKQESLSLPKGGILEVRKSEIIALLKE